MRNNCASNRRPARSPQGITRSIFVLFLGALRSSSVARGGCLRNGLFQIAEFFAALRAQGLEPRNIFLRFWHVAHFDIELAQIFERTLVVGIEFERLLIEGQRILPVTALAQTEA